MHLQTPDTLLFYLTVLNIKFVGKQPSHWRKTHESTELT